MGDTIWINIRNGNKRKSNEQDHSATLSLTEEFDALATKLDVKPLSSFYDDTDLRYNLDEIGEFEESDDGWSNDQAKWFDASDAYTSANAILAEIKSNSSTVNLLNWSLADVVWELEDIIEELKKAVKENRAFHFCIVM